MHDIRAIRENPEAFDAALARRGAEPQAQAILDLDERRRSQETAAQEGSAKRNQLAKAIGQAKAKGNEEEFRALREQGERLKAIEDACAQVAKGLSEELRALLAAIPNLPAPDVPDGTDEEDNQLVHARGQHPVFPFTPREHHEFGPAIGLDFDTGAKLGGSRFTFLRGAAAKLHRALGQFMLDTLTSTHGYDECVPPILVRDEIMFGTGQLPKFAEDSFSTSLKPDIIDFFESQLSVRVNVDRNDANALATMRGFLEEISRNIPTKAERRWLIPTSEVSLTNSVREQILSGEELPLRLTALTPCFRSEAGAAGRDTRGFIRQHQFEKVEMVSITTPDQSEAEHERMTACAEDILTRLGLPFRRMLLCAGDMGFSATRTYDLEVWLPGQARYREISSCSTCGDFQARRMNARYRGADGKPAFVHTLNGSGLAVGRTLVAVLENYQQEDGAVAVPDVLQPYLRGVNRLEPRG